MSAATATNPVASPMTLSRILAGVVAATFFVDAAFVMAPGLALGGVPFLLMAIFVRRATVWTAVVHIVLGALLAVIAIPQLLFDLAGRELPDVVFILVDAPLSLVLIGLGIRTLVDRRR